VPFIFQLPAINCLAPVMPMPLPWRVGSGNKNLARNQSAAGPVDLGWCDLGAAGG
jgi:hypothetical protein